MPRQVLVQDFEVVCRTAPDGDYEPTYLLFSFIGVLAIIVYPLGIPAMYGCEPGRQRQVVQGAHLKPLGLCHRGLDRAF